MVVRESTELDYSALLRFGRQSSPASISQNIKVALLADAATQRVSDLLRSVFRVHGVEAQIREGPFDGVEIEVYDPRSALYEGQPEAVVILNTVQALRSKYFARSGNGVRFVNEVAERTVRIWETIRSHSAATIIQTNFVLPYERFFGSFDHKVPESFYSAVLALNARLAEAARERPGVLIGDVDAVASWVGRRHWFDDRLWDLAKYPCAPDHLPALAECIADIVMAAQGRVVKCVVLDLDGTLWGGVIGDDGLEGIVLSAHGDGESYHRLQCFLRELRQRGILLCVCSKNDFSNAVLPFEKHPEMVLKRDDFAVFMANWRDKAENIRRIQETLNIGFDSMVFLDDNPFERNLVRKLVPGVIVPELPEDPAEYVRAIAGMNLFETASFSGEDLQRADFYRKESERREAQGRFATVEEFLQSLDMRMTVARFDSFHLPRIAQLIQRSNQFNLTTRRLSEADCAALKDDQRWIPIYARLTDRFGDHGLISVVTLEIREDELAIRDWLMSCRVVGRGVEQYLMNVVFERARELGLARVVGEYVPTAKNGMVKDFFARFGFNEVEVVNGYTRWALGTDAHRAVPTFIKSAGPNHAAVGADLKE